MKRMLAFCFIIVLCISCKDEYTEPDVSDIKVSLTVTRYEDAFFGMDTLLLQDELENVYAKHPLFTRDYLYNILAVTPQPDSTIKDVKHFLRTHRDVYADVKKQYASFASVEKELLQAFKYLRFYFPEKQLPSKLITFIGPINSFANIVVEEGLAVGLQMYMGANYPLYLTEQVQSLYPAYISRKFAKEYIAVNCVKNLLDDWFTPPPPGKSLIEQMIEIGKRQYLLKRIFPKTPDSLLIGYTGKQLKNCLENEKAIWAYFVQNDLLYETQPALIQEYVNEGPNTASISIEAPGNIGAFTGWQIVRKWMSKQKEVSLSKLMQTPAKQLFEEAKYKP